jgi:hypothetical protein
MPFHLLKKSHRPCDVVVLLIVDQYVITKVIAVDPGREFQGALVRLSIKPPKLFDGRAVPRANGDDAGHRMRKGFVGGDGKPGQQPS